MVICREMADAIKMPFGVLTRVGPMNHVLGGGLDRPWEAASLGIVLFHWKCFVTRRVPK